MRQKLADLFHWLSVRACNRAVKTTSAVWKLRWLRRSEFWSDCECWIVGLDSWKNLRSRRRRAGHLQLRRI